ncbi:MAG: hypothetical protein PHH17_00875 [Candidatus Pacebacteria bacterium]|nr:hypothetical protein [Candidatus Paceibacterota bacterium]MDD3728862.1 hypothetical protein [Candidatus Paceibacterota bacterium]MDD5445751.1 hypothetical protein [Candidatus Paceibacterota bacterium]
MKKKNLKIHKIIFFFLAFFVFFSLLPFTIAADKEEERAQLEKELKELEELILKYDKDITKTEAEKQTLQYQISNIRRKIDQLNLQIRQSNLVIQSLGLKIQDTEKSIMETTVKIGEMEEKLIDILRITEEEDKKSYIEIILQGETISDFFDNIVYLEVLNLKNKGVLKDIKDLKFNLEGHKISLDGEKDSLQKTVQLQALQVKESEAARKKQEDFLKMTEAQYQQYLKEKQELEKKAEEIRSKMLELVGIPDVETPTFGEALEVARWVQQLTGVRPAFLLAIITQESALGRNVGQCYLKDASTGSSVGINSGRIFSNGIHPTRDLPPFLILTKELGRNSLSTPISCPVIGIPGYGGAMGPAQFIPSTWNLYKSRLTNMLGRIADPWKINDSFLASGLLLSDNLSSSSNNERTAALKYFAGGNWNKSSYAFYGNQIVQRINCLQVFIDQGTMTDTCSGLIFIPS